MLCTMTLSYLRYVGNMSNSRYIVRIGDMLGFMNKVFGADIMLENWPELGLAEDDGGGVSIRKYPDGMYYILDEGEHPVSASAFFDRTELRYLKFDDDVQFTSNAAWPLCTYSHDNDVTTDGPQSMETACVICDMLSKDGWGGEGTIKPLVTWVEPI